MNNIANTINKIYEDIKNKKNFIKHQNLIITGNNCTGKTKLIKQILEKSIKDTPDLIYYIGAKNRNIVETQDSGISITLEELDIKKIIEIRLDDKLSSLDLFTETDRGGTVAFFEMLRNLVKYNEMFIDFFGISISKSNEFDERISGSVSIKINNEYDITNVSTSEAAQMRILMEVNYAFEHGYQAIIIDEFDSFIEMQNLIDFIHKLLKRYSLRFIFIIQALETLVRLEGIDVALISQGINNIIDENKVTFIDADDVTQIGQIHRLRNVLISTSNIEENNLESGVASIIKRGELDCQYLCEFNKIDRNKLKTKDKILYDYIVEYIKKNESFSSN